MIKAGLEPKALAWWNRTGGEPLTLK